MKKVSFLPFALTAALSLQPLVNGHAEEASSVLQMLGEGDTSLSFRYRYEFVDQDGVVMEGATLDNLAAANSELTNEQYVLVYEDAESEPSGTIVG